jgi:hypothetical protein
MPNTRKRGTATIRRMTRQLVAKIPSFRTATRKDCPPGHVLRKAYSRHYSTAVRLKGFTVKKTSGKVYRIHPSQKNTHINATCVKDTKVGPKSVKKQIGPLKKGELAKYGYSFRASESQRHAALQKAIAEYTALGVYRKLDAVAKLTVNTVPAAAKVFAGDREWVRKVGAALKKT